MKIYTRNTKIALSIVLLSFNALSACADRRQKLGIDFMTELAAWLAAGALLKTGNQTGTLSLHNNTNLSANKGMLRLTNNAIHPILNIDKKSILSAIETDPIGLVSNKKPFKKQSFSDIFDAVWRNDFSIERLTNMLNQGLDPNTIDPETRCMVTGPLIDALITYGKLRELDLVLLWWEVDPNMEDGYGFTLLEIVVSNCLVSNDITPDKAKAMIDLLIYYGADPCIKNSRGRTVLSYIAGIDRSNKLSISENYTEYKRKSDEITAKLKKTMKITRCDKSRVKTKRHSFC